MSFELVVTSAPKGLRPGSRGFSSVGFTEGMPANYVQFCESISGYVHVFTPEHPNYTKNPPAFSHLLAPLGGRTFSILSRVGSCGLDYTGRSNKLAHHVMISPEERPDQGPAVLMNSAGLFMDQWSGPPRYFPPNNTKLPRTEIASFRPKTWERMLGAPDGAGILAQTFLDAPQKPSFILFEPEQAMDVLPLLAEAQALLPAMRRWDVTFSTYFTTLPVGLECAWRCCLPDSDALKVARRTPGVLIVDLPNRRITGPTPGDPQLLQFARTGQPPEQQRPTLSVVVPKVTVQSLPGQKVHATQSAERSSQPRLRIDYSNAMRPRPPQKARKPRTFLWLACAGAFVFALILALAAFSFFRRSPGAAAGLDSANTPRTQTNAAPASSDQMSPLTQGGNPQDDTSRTRMAVGSSNAVSDATNIPPPELKSPAVAQHPGTNPPANPSPTVPVAQTNTATPSSGVASNDVQHTTAPPSGALPIVFYDVTGVTVDHQKIPAILGNPPQYKRKTGSDEALARENFDGRELSSFAPSVQLILVEVASTGHEIKVCSPNAVVRSGRKTLHVLQPIRAVVSRESTGTLRVVPPQNPASEVLLTFIRENGEANLTATGKRGSSASVEFPPGSISVATGTFVVGRCERWEQEQEKLNKQITELSNTAATITIHIDRLTECLTNLEKTVASFDSSLAKLGKNVKTAKDVDKNRHSAAKAALKSAIDQSFQIYLSGTNLATQTDPVSSFDNFKNVLASAKETLAKQKEKEGPTRRAEFTRRYNQNDCEILGDIVDALDDSGLKDVVKALVSELLPRRQKALAAAKTIHDDEQKKQRDLLAALETAPLTISIKHGGIPIIDASSQK